MSRFSTLLHGNPVDVYNELDYTDATNPELRAALQNAMRQLHKLNKQVADLEAKIAKMYA